MNKRVLYESIMRDVSKIVKKALIESEDKEQSELDKVVETLLKDLKTNNKDLDLCIEFMRIVSKGRESKTFYKGIPYSKLLPELEKRLKDEK